jgi:3-hydroxyisobutyrate dehydrogenase-like beta-hydroxyacid dehydrogenase
MSNGSIRRAVGVVGLGIMGSAYARNLLKNGFEVVGTDVSADARSAISAAGGLAVASATDVAREADVILLALPSVAALRAVAAELGAVARPGTVVCEMGTFPISAKEEARAALAAAGITLLDSPVSGTGAQAATGDLVIYASGDVEAYGRVKPVFEGFAREVRHVGGFGDGMKLKCVANLLVTIHNLAAAEALTLARQAGLDLGMVYDAIRSGAGTSRMFEVRGPMMVADRYEPATMKMEVYMKDLQVILDFARDVRAPTPLMAASVPFYVAALAQGRGKEDTAALFGVLSEMSDPRPAET